MISELQKDILELKKQKDAYILAHSYQAREIVEIADFVGDSFALTLAAQKAKQKTILMCGVRFMAETVKILSPEKTVILVNQEAGCPMAEQIEPEMVEYFKSKNTGYTVVAYINTTAKLKTVCDVCVTSSSAVKIVNSIENENILFLPDCNLGDYIAKQLPHKNVKLMQGGCPVHAAVKVEDVEKAKQLHPNAKLLVHPECVPKVVEMADYVGSTSGIMDYAKNSSDKEFIIGTEISITEHLQYECRDKKFFNLSKKILCPNMKLTTLVDVYNSLNDDGGEKIELSKEEIEKARICIDEMIRLG